MAYSTWYEYDTRYRPTLILSTTCEEYETQHKAVCVTSSYRVCYRTIRIITMIPQVLVL